MTYNDHERKIIRAQAEDALRKSTKPGPSALLRSWAQVTIALLNEIEGRDDRAAEAGRKRAEPTAYERMRQGLPPPGRIVSRC